MFEYVWSIHWQQLQKINYVSFFMKSIEKEGEVNAEHKAIEKFITASYLMRILTFGKTPEINYF